MVILGMVFASALAVGPLFDRLLVLQRRDAPLQWEAAGRPCPDFWRLPGVEQAREGLSSERLSSELAALRSIASWIAWTPPWIEAHGGAMRLLWGLRALALGNALTFALQLSA